MIRRCVKKKKLRLQTLCTAVPSKKVRGEIETSPRAWSRHFMGSYGAGTGGNISTCVEQTCPVSSPGCPRRKHLHMRGADMVLSDVHCSQIETSPHAWSRHVSYDTQAINARNISTCVEQTRPPTRVRAPAWKHLHMRGADLSGMVWLQSESETSPHAWSRLHRT